MMTLREVRELVDMECRSERIPSKKMLENMNVQIVAKEMINEDTEITVYKNGYVLYRAGKKATVFALPDQAGYTYRFASGNSVLDADFFENENWYVRLIMEGEDRLAENQRRQEVWNGVYSYSEKNEDETKDLIAPSSDVLEQMILKETVEELFVLMTNRQKKVLHSYFFEEMSQEEIAKQLGISQQWVCMLLKRTTVRLGKVLKNKKI